MALSDNSSAIGWVYKSANLDPSSWYYNAVQLMARQVASLVLQSGNALCAQHLPGSHNTVSDWLSYSTQLRNGMPNPLAGDDPSDATLTHRFHSYIPQMIPSGFRISPLPDEILHFVEHTLRIAESSLIRHNQSPKTTRIAHGHAGSDSAAKPPSWTRYSLIYPPTKKIYSCEPSWNPSLPPTGLSQAAFLERIRAPWRDRLCGLPQAIWLRRFGTVSNGAPFTSRTAPGYSLP